MNKNGELSDAFSFAIFLLELVDINRVHNVYAADPLLVSRMSVGVRPDISWVRDPWLRILVVQSWAHNPTDRRSFLSILGTIETVLKGGGSSVTSDSGGSPASAPASSPPIAVPTPKIPVPTVTATVDDVPTIVVDTPGRRIASVNAALLLAGGYDHCSELVGTPFDELVNGESCLRCRDGETVPIEIQLTPDLERSQIVARVLAHGCSVDPNSTFQEQRRNSLLLGKILEHSPDGIVVLRIPEGGGPPWITTASLSASSVLGSDIHPNDPSFLPSLLDEEEQVAQRKDIERMRAGLPCSSERRLRNGRVVRVRGYPLPSETEGYRKALCTLEDVTEVAAAREAREALQRAQQRHALALDRIADVVMEVRVGDWADPLGTCAVVEANDAYAALFGEAWCEREGAWPALCTDREALRAVLVRAEQPPHAEVRFAGARSRVRHVRVSTVHLEEFGTDRLLVVCHDLTDFKFRIEAEKDRQVAAKLQHEVRRWGEEGGRRHPTPSRGSCHGRRPRIVAGSPTPAALLATPPPLATFPPTLPPPTHPPPRRRTRMRTRRCR